MNNLLRPPVTFLFIRIRNPISMGRIIQARLISFKSIIQTIKHSFSRLSNRHIYRWIIFSINNQLQILVGLWLVGNRKDSPSLFKLVLVGPDMSVSSIDINALASQLTSNFLASLTNATLVTTNNNSSTTIPIK